MNIQLVKCFTKDIRTILMKLIIFIIFHCCFYKVLLANLSSFLLRKIALEIKVNKGPLHHLLPNFLIP